MSQQPQLTYVCNISPPIGNAETPQLDALLERFDDSPLLPPTMFDEPVNDQPPQRYDGAAGGPVAE